MNRRQDATALAGWTSARSGEDARARAQNVPADLEALGGVGSNASSSAVGFVLTSEVTPRYSASRTLRMLQNPERELRRRQKEVTMQPLFSLLATQAPRRGKSGTDPNPVPGG
jgi:hypothetical protein